MFERPIHAYREVQIDWAPLAPPVQPTLRARAMASVLVISVGFWIGIAHFAGLI